MIQARYFYPDRPVVSDIQPAQFAGLIQDPQGLLWVDFVGEPPEACEPILHEIFGFHPLAVEDALHQTHVPKLDDWEEYLYIALQAIQVHHGAIELDLTELDIFLGRNFIVTHHDFLIDSLKRVWDASSQHDRFFKKGSDHLLYRVTDELVADFMLAIEELDEEIEYIEDEVFGNPSPEIVQKIFTLKRTTIRLRRVITPLREVLNRLARDDFSVIDEKDQIYFRDVYDHLVRLYEIVEGLRDLVGGVLDTYLSVINNRMNEIMKTLTIITTVFMPISFLAGFFGMNYFAPSILSSAWTGLPSFIISMVIFLITPLLMFLWIRRRGWMG